MYDGKIGLYLIEQIEQSRECITDENFDLAISYLQKGLESIKGLEVTYSEEMVKIYKLLGLCYRKKNMPMEGLQILKKAELLCRKMYFRDKNVYWRRELAVCYMNEAIIYDSQEETENAINLYKNAIYVFKEIEDSESCVKAMVSLGLAYGKVDNIEAFTALCRDALDIIDGNFTLECYRKIFCDMQEEILK